MTNILTYEEGFVNRRFCCAFHKLFNWLNRQRWNKHILTEGSPDGHYTLTIKKFTEEDWDIDVSVKVIKLFNCKFILISV